MSLTSQEKSSPIHCQGRLGPLSRRYVKLHFPNEFEREVPMQFNTTSQATTEVFRQGSSESTFDGLMKNELFRKWHKLGLAILVIACFALGCILPLWYSGHGWISNKSLHPSDFVNPGLQFGSQTVYAEKGETIKVIVDVHEITRGGLYVKIFRRGWDVKSYKESARMTVSQPTKQTLTRVANVSDWYYIEFLGDGRSTYTDALFSAEWEVN